MSTVDNGCMTPDCGFGLMLDFVGWGLRAAILALLVWGTWSLLAATYRWIRRHTR
jgi:hypothetical protein